MAGNPNHDEGGKFSSSDHVRNAAYEHVKQSRDRIEANLKEASEKLNQFPRGQMGLTPDHIKSSPEYQNAKKTFDTHFQQLRNTNEHMNKHFKAEIKQDRMSRRNARKS